MSHENHVFVAACVFASKYPALSARIQAYLKERFSMPIIRCCVPQYELKKFEDAMPDWYRPQWKDLPDFQEFTADHTMVYVCHNCRNIFLEQHPEVATKSLWELVLEDESFPLPDFHGETIAVQDCWRSNDNRAEQDAVRALLRKMNINIVEMPERYEETEFCGYSLLQPQPPRNPKLAPKRYVEKAAGKFQPHTDEEKQQIMADYCRGIPTDKVIAYCHYCIDGLKLGGKNGIHLAEILFGMDSAKQDGVNIADFMEETR